MNKYVVALAFLASTGALAQSSVSITGVLDVAVSRVETDDGERSISTTGMYPSGMSSSLLRFEGREDLGGGLFAVFRLESGLNLDSGTGIASNTNNQRSGVAPSSGLTFNRWAYVGVGSAAFGELRVGRVYTAAFENFTPFDVFLTNGIGSSTPVSLRLGLRNTQTALNVSNAIDYSSPHYGKGFFARGTLATGENPSNGNLATNNPRRGGDHGALRVGYSGGPLTIALSAGLTKNTAGVTPTGNNAGDYLNSNLAVRYELGYARVLGQYVTERLDGATAAGGSLTGVDSDRAKTRTFLLGVVIPVGLGNVKFSVADARLSDNNRTPAEKGRLYVAGYDYFFSKRTNIYAALARVNNNDVGRYGFATAFPAPGVGQSTTGVSAGLRHTF